MESKNLLTLAITLTVGIILAGSLLMPVISDATTTEKSFSNDGFYTMDKIESDSEFVLSWNPAEPASISIDDKKIDLSTRGLANGLSYTVFGGDNFVLRLSPSSIGTTIQFFGSKTTSPGFIAADTVSNSTLTATVTGGNITIASTDPNYPNSATFAISDNTYCINVEDSGKYVMKKATETAFIETNTDIIVLDGMSSLAGDVGIYADGKINGDLDATVFRGDTTYPVTFSDWTYSTSPVNGYIDLVKLEKVVFTATQNSTDYTVTYSYFIVPSTVTAELSNHMTPGEIAILNALPILIIVALVVMAAGALYLKRDD